MIVVSVQLVSAIHPSRSKELARMEICNEDISPDGKLGDYSVRTLTGRSKESLDRRVINRVGKILKHKRLDEHVWYLVAKALKAIKYDPSSST